MFSDGEKMDGEYLQEEVIDGLKLPEATKIAGKYKLDTSKAKNLDQIKCCIKRHLLQDRQRRVDVINGLAVSADKDVDQRKDLLNIYETALRHLEVEQTLQNQLSQSFPEPMCLLEKEIKKLEQNFVRCPILVLGETGAGKSSFINLVLGCELLPHSLLSNTSAICEIQYGDTYLAILHLENGVIETHPCESFEKLKEILSDSIQRSANNLPMCKRAEIHLPVDILRTGLFIVDSPGIGETGDMTNLVLDYLMEACAFIYVINSQSAGGVAPERLLDLLKKVVERSFQDKGDFRSECAIFVCNKWDQIPLNERKAVYDDTVEKLTDSGTGWPKCQASQIFTLSTKEAAIIQQSEDRYVVGQFNKILQEINRLVPTAREIALWNSARLLKQIVDRTLFCLDHSRMKIEMKPEERKKVTRETVERLVALKNEVNVFFAEEKVLLFKGLEKITEKLSKHLLSPRTIPKICTFKDNDIPKEKQWKEATIIVRCKLYDRLAEEIRAWECEQRGLEKLGNEIANRFSTKFPDFDSKLLRAQRLCTSNTEGKALLEEESHFIPTPVAKSFSSLNLGLKVLVGVSLSPVILIGALVRLPVWAVKELKRKIENKYLESDYEKDREKTLKKYAESTFKATVDPVKMKPIIEEEIVTIVKYLEQQRAKVIHQIDADLSLFEKQTSDENTEETTSEISSMGKIKFEWLLKRLLLFYKMNLPLPDYYTSKTSLQIENLVHDGVFSSFNSAKWDSPSMPERRVLVRKSKVAINETNILSHLRIEELYRHSQMVYNLKCVAMVMEEQMMCWQVFVPITCTLREKLRKEEVPKDKSKKYYIYMEQVVSGLSFLHSKSLIHMDLSMDSVVVDEDGRLKLVDINSQDHKHTSFFDSEATDIRRYIHFHHSILTGKAAFFAQVHDMYSVGIMMYEMWKGHEAFKSQIENPEMHISTLRDFASFVSIPSNMLELDTEDGLGILEVNKWNDCIKRCQMLEVTVNDWFGHVKCCTYTYSQAQCPIPTTSPSW